MIDIVSIGADLGVLDTDTPRAKNILSVQVGTLVYATDFGIDLKYFLSQDFEFQNASFKSYLIQVLANNSINVASLDESVNTLFSTYGFNLTPTSSGKTLVAG
jgi:hypothetical protein